MKNHDVTPPWLVSRDDLSTGLENPKCHATTLAETEKGLRLAFFGGSDFGMSGQAIWLMSQSPRGWETARRVVDGHRGASACWNPVLHQVPGGPLLLFYKQGDDPSTWRGMLVRSKDAGRTWSPPLPLPDDVYGPIRSKPVGLRDGTLLCPSSTERGAWCVHFERATDDGRTWSRTPAVADPRGVDAIQPTVVAWPDGRLQALCRSRAGGIVETTSTDGGERWTALRPTGLPNPNSGIEALLLADGRALLVYNPTAPAPRETHAMRSPLSLAVTRDGHVWTRIGDVDDAPVELSYPAAIQTADGRVHVSYTAGGGWTGMRHAVIDPTRIVEGAERGGGSLP